MALDEPTRSGPPAAYFPEPGDHIIVGIVDVGTYQQRDYDTGELKTWPDGGKVEGKVVTGLVIAANGAKAGTSKAHDDVNPGDLVTFWCEGGKFYTWRDAVDAHGPVDRGDVMLWRRERDQPAKNPRHNPRKVHFAKLRKPKAEDGDIVARCIAAHRELSRTAPLDVPVAAAVPQEVPF